MGRSALLQLSRTNAADTRRMYRGDILMRAAALLLEKKHGQGWPKATAQPARDILVRSIVKIVDLLNVLLG